MRRQAATGAGRYRRQSGLVAGAVLRAARLSANVTKNAVAAAAGVSRNVVRAWENGTSPLASVPEPDLKRLEAALAEHGSDQRLVADLGPAVWCDLVVSALELGQPVSCLLADPITGERAFRELLSWSLIGQIPARYRRYFAPAPLIANQVLIDRALHVVASVHPDLAADCLSAPAVSVTVTPAPPRAGSRNRDRHQARRLPHANPHARPAPRKCRRLRL